ncbi:MAG: NAD(P)H-binding protein [Pseudomonadota bacterium]
MASAQRPVHVSVAGATGLVGRALLARLVADVRIGPITALVRQPDALTDLAPRVQTLVVDPRASGQGHALPPTDWAFCALGTTIRAAGSQAAFRAVDVDAVLAFAQAARAAGATRFGLVSAMGADVRSAVFYNRCKGEVEQALAAQGWPQLVVARPSLLLGQRQALGQTSRPMESLAQRLMPVVGWLIPAPLRPIHADAVASALLRAVASDRPGVTTLLSHQLQALADHGPG